jgi:serine/threonine protein kinase
MIVIIVQQVGSALFHAHQFGYVHRDVKPGNILLAKDGRVLLSDFGVVKLIGDSPMTVAGAIVGTSEYRLRSKAVVMDRSVRCPISIPWPSSPMN